MRQDNQPSSRTPHLNHRLQPFHWQARKITHPWVTVPSSHSHHVPKAHSHSNSRVVGFHQEAGLKALFVEALSQTLCGVQNPILHILWNEAMYKDTLYITIFKALNYFSGGRSSHGSWTPLFSAEGWSESWQKIAFIKHLLLGTMLVEC